MRYVFIIVSDDINREHNHLDQKQNMLLNMSQKAKSLLYVIAFSVCRQSYAMLSDEQTL